MANLKNITELPVAESAEGLNLIVNDGGAAKQIAASAVGAQADWAETNENSPAFIKNKPVEELDLNIEVVGSYYENDDGDNGRDIEYTVKSINTFANIKNKIFGAVAPKGTAKLSYQKWGNVESPYAIERVDGPISYHPENFFGDGSPECIQFSFWGTDFGCYAILTSDDVLEVFLD